MATPPFVGRAASEAVPSPFVPVDPRPHARRARGRVARALRFAQRLHAPRTDASLPELLHAIALAAEAETAFVADLDAPAAAWRIVASACGGGALLDAGSGHWPADELPELAQRLRRAGYASLAAHERHADASVLLRANVGRLTVVALDPSRTAVLGLCAGAAAPAPDATLRALLELAAARVAALREAQQLRGALERAEERLALTVHGAAAGWFEWDLQRGRIDWSPRLRALFGYEAGDPPEAALWNELVWPEDLARVEAAVSAHFDGQSDCFDECFRGRRKDGSWFWAWVRFKAGRDRDGRLTRAVGTVLDVSDKVRVERRLALEHERMRTTLAALGDAVVTVDGAGRVEYANPAAERLVGPQAVVRGRPIEAVVPLGAPLTTALERCVLEGAPRAIAESPLAGEHPSRFVAGTVAPLLEPGGATRGAVVVLRDVSESRALRERLTHQASHDPLTGLLNRRELDARLARAVAGAREQGAAHAFLYVDLDQFKVLNDSCGHAAGDALLAELGGALGATVPAGASVARLGGDEFGVLLEDHELARAVEVAERIRAAIAALRFVWRGQGFRLGASVGVVAVGGASAAEVLAAADTACYAAKDAGRDRVHVARRDDQELKRRGRELGWARELSAALDADRFELHRQEVRALREAPAGAAPGRHYELLLRLRDADGRLVPPEAFLRAAERYGVMPRLERWVVRHTFGWLAAHPDEQGTYALNLSGPAVADPRFQGFVRAELAASGVAPTRVCFEVTESVAIADLDAAVRFLKGLRTAGCRTALDDFGTGLASFAYLRRLPLDFVKVDGSFVRNAVADPVDREVVQAVQAVAGRLGVRSIAECVEDQATLDLMRALGVDLAQGWAVGRPEPLVRPPGSG
jgi:diguanylate cyclase (GGDEF)-like protein/PAS domain S-box-containing protein